MTPSLNQEAPGNKHFPNRATAEAEFRECWRGFLWLTHPGRRQDMLSHLEELSEAITDDQEELYRFFHTVPGFEEFWYAHNTEWQP